VQRLVRDAWGFRQRALRATACVVIPLAILCLAGHPQAGVIAVEGGFAGLYAFDEPYRRRSPLVLGIGVAMAAAMALGTLVASTPVAAVAVAAVVAAVSAAACLAARVGPPREYFIIFTFLVATALPSEPADAPGRAGLVLLGVAVAWVVSMAGALRDRRRPERTAVEGAYRAVARLLDAIGRPAAPAARHEAVVAVRRALRAVEDADGADSADGAGLVARAEGAEALLEAALALVIEGSSPLDRAWGRSVATLAEGALAPIAIPPATAAPAVPAGRRLAAALRAVSAAGGSAAEPDGAGGPFAGMRLRWRASLAEIADRARSSASRRCGSASRSVWPARSGSSCAPSTRSGSRCRPPPCCRGRTSRWPGAARCSGRRARRWAWCSPQGSWRCVPGWPCWSCSWR
jgi:hypothetical protein